jgi:hypothetical protein
MTDMLKAIEKSLEDHLGWSEATTIERFLIRDLVENMLWPKEAVTVVEKMKEEDETRLRFGDSLDAYPRSRLAVLSLSARRRAVEWIDENKPEHYARTLLAGELR